MTRILLIATGDTIAYGRQRVLRGADLLAGLPAGGVPAGPVHTDVTVEDVRAEPGWDISPATMLALARRVRAALLDDRYDGVVVTHGVDTVEDSAFLADLLAGPAVARGGIVFTGALRRADDPDPDGPGNLAAAIVAAGDPVLRMAGAVVCAGGEVHAARWARLADAAGPAPFTSDPVPPLGRVIGDRVQLIGTPPSRPPRAQGEPATDVALIKTYPGMDGTLLAAAVDAGAAGIVLEGTGAGNVPASLLATISDLTEWKIPVVIASRARTGATPGLGAGLAARVGAIDARGLSASKARIALTVALGTGSADGARQWFAEF